MSPLYFLVSLYTLKKKLKSVFIKGLLRGNFQWVYTAYIIFLATIKQKFVLMKHTELPRFKGKAGEIQ